MCLSPCRDYGRSRAQGPPWARASGSCFDWSPVEDSSTNRITHCHIQHTRSPFRSSPGLKDLAVHPFSYTILVSPLSSIVCVYCINAILATEA